MGVVLTPEKPILPLSFYASPLSPEGGVFAGDPVYPHTVVLASDESEENKEITIAALLDLARSEDLKAIKRVHALEYYLVYSKNPDSKIIAAEIFASMDHKTFETIEEYISIFKKFDFDVMFPKGLSLVQDSSIPADVREKFVRDYLFGANKSQRAALDPVLLSVAIAENSFDFAVLLVRKPVEKTVSGQAQTLVMGMIEAETDLDKQAIMIEACKQRDFKIDLSGK